jgi:hypothetical protein
MRRPGNRGSWHGARRRLAQQGGGVSREGTCGQRSATCSASPLAGAQLSQVRRGDGSPTVERPPLAVQKSSVSIYADRRKGRPPAGAVSALLAGDGLAQAVACMRSSMTLDGFSRAGISRLRPAIFSHHSAEYLAPIIPSRVRIHSALSYHNRGEIMYAG